MDIKKCLIFLLLLAMGCAPLVKTSFSHRQEYVNSHSGLSLEIKQSILKGEVMNGMTKEDVLAILGKPTRISAEQYGESWFYDQPFFSLRPWAFVSFTPEGKVYNSGEGYAG